MIAMKYVRLLDKQPKALGRCLLPLGTMVIAACAHRSAPAVVLFGAYFPDWLLFAMLAIVTAIVARAVFGATGWGASVPFPLFTYLAVGILVAGTVDLLWLWH